MSRPNLGVPCFHTIALKLLELCFCSRRLKVSFLCQRMLLFVWVHVYVHSAYLWHSGVVFLHCLILTRVWGGETPEGRPQRPHISALAETLAVPGFVHCVFVGLDFDN